MANDHDVESQNVLKGQIKFLRGQCKHICNVIENAPLDAHSIDNEETQRKINCYAQGLREAVQNSDTFISTNDNQLTSQFLKELREKTVQIKELSAFTKGAILDTDAEINRLKTLIKTVDEVESKAKISQHEVQPEHVGKAKEKFHVMKNALHSLMQSLFPQCHEAVGELIGDLMSAKLKKGIDPYVQITSENYKLVQLLKDMNIITVNPYNNFEVKLLSH